MCLILCPLPNQAIGEGMWVFLTNSMRYMTTRLIFLISITFHLFENLFSPKKIDMLFIWKFEIDLCESINEACSFYGRSVGRSSGK